MVYDIAKLRNKTGSTLTHRNRTFGPYECFSFKSERGLVQSGAVAFTHVGTVVRNVYIEPEDQADYTNRPEVHRYFHPSFFGGADLMLKVPKAVVYFDSHAEYGEVLFVRYYFWCDIVAVNSLAFSSFTVDEALSKASDVVTEVMPLPEERFVMPIWRSLPEDFNLRTHRSRKDALMARIRS